MEATTSKCESLTYFRIRLASESSTGSDLDHESIHSVQGRETATPKDTSDLTSDSSDTGEGTGTFYYEVGRQNDLEYEVVDVDDGPDVPFSSSEDSEHDLSEIATLGAVAAAITHKWDNGLDADTSSACGTSPTSSSDVDPELPRADYNEFWTCVQCKEANENTNYQMCHKCYVMRKSFFPPRQTRKRKRLLKVRGETKKLRLDVDTQESGIDGCSTSQGSQLVSAGESLSVEQSAEDQVDGPVSKSTPKLPSCDTLCPSQPSDSSDQDLCSICCVNPRNGLFIHGNTAHSNFCCNKCAFKTWKSIGCCPLCRRKVRQVVKLL